MWTRRMSGASRSESTREDAWAQAREELLQRRLAQAIMSVQKMLSRVEDFQDLGI